MEKDSIRRVFDPLVIVGAVGFGVLLAAAALGLLWLTRTNQAPAGGQTAVLTVIPAATITPTVAPPTATLPVEPTGTGLPLPPPGDVSLEAYVQISGTGGDGLRLRSDPGLNSDVRMLGEEAEVFVVKDGPEEADGYTWWYLVGPADETRRGWAVANYLMVVQNP
jgi:hypothetical protein